jgi:putative acetyltransferase
MTVVSVPRSPGNREVSVEVERAAFGSGEEPSIVEAVRDEEGSFALVAEKDGVVAGHVQLSRAWIGETSLLVLGPIGVLPDRQRRGIGSALMRSALEEAQGRGEPAVIPFGDPGSTCGSGSSRARRPASRIPTPAGSCRTGRSSPRRTSWSRRSTTGRSLAGEVRCHPALTMPVEADDPAL